MDGLLRALGLNCRTIHAQLQQRQRLRALESFSASPIGVLVATDVAARGLDIAKVNTVLHYDVARSPQVYVHRAGRTARAGAKGTSLSLVGPEDAAHHQAICVLLGVAQLGPLAVDGQEVDILRERVALAKKVRVGIWDRVRVRVRFSYVALAKKVTHSSLSPSQHTPECSLSPRFPPHPYTHPDLHAELRCLAEGARAVVAAGRGKGGRPGDRRAPRGRGGLCRGAQAVRAAEQAQTGSASSRAQGTTGQARSRVQAKRQPPEERLRCLCQVTLGLLRGVRVGHVRRLGLG